MSKNSAFTLEGIRILDFSWVMAGPMATKMFGAMGAEVIKVETSTRSEFSSRTGLFSAVNHNKRSCTLNITTPDGQALVRDLMARSDVVVENFSAGVLDKYDLGYDVARRQRPDIVFVSASGLGRTGPERELVAYGSLLQAYSGRVSMIGELNPYLEAMGILPAWTDPITCFWEVLAIISALYHRSITGEGAYIDLSMLESTVALLPEALLCASLKEEHSETGSNAEIRASPSGCFRTSGEDEWLAISVRTDDQWRALCGLLDLPGLANEPRYMEKQVRLAARNELNHLVEDWASTRSAAVAIEALHALGIPAARSRHVGELAADPHLLSRGVFRLVDEVLEMSAIPWRDETGWRGSLSKAPMLGADNDYVFGSLLGLDDDRRRQLVTAGAIR